ncbi:MAG: class I SAM-dependent methyltransferase [Cyanobacteria bacterium P01_F01_bin.143]
MQDTLVLKLKTKINSDNLTKTLTQYEPWGHRIDFSNGVSTSTLKQRMPFAHNTLQKIKIVEKAIPFTKFRGGEVLDIGCNSGYNSIYLASKYNMHPSGIDVSSRHIEVSNMLSKIANIDADYMIGNAETYSRKNNFDVILHFGTLYHLPNPLLSLQTTYKNLKKGGYLALETQVYDHPTDQNICYFMHMQNNDKTNFWALSTHVLRKYMEIVGFFDIQELLRVSPALLEENMSRIILVAKK